MKPYETNLWGITAAMDSHGKILPENRGFYADSDAADAPAARLQSCIYGIDAIPQAFESHWQILSGHTAETNIFYEPALLMASFRHLETGDPIRLFTLWGDKPLKSTLLGIIPLSDMQRYSHWPLPHVQNWKHPNCFLGAPLVHIGYEKLFWKELLTYLDERKGEHGFFHLNGLVQDGPLLKALQDLGCEQDRPVNIVHSEERALLENVTDAESYYAATVRAKKRKELRRLRNRLDDEGEVTFHNSAGQTITADALAIWTEEFLKLEQSGWKGDNGSALACAPQTRSFFAAALVAAHQSNALHLIDMRLDDEPIAMLVNFKSGMGGFSFKTTFDERYARYSPGVLLQIENLSAFKKLGLDWIDSCAAEGHPMIDSLWSSRRHIVRVSIALNGTRRRAYFAAVHLAESSMTYVRSLLNKDRI